MTIIDQIKNVIFWILNLQKKTESQELFLNEITGECDICHNVPAKYRCPNCGAVYCTSNCFKSHNNQCVNKFSNKLINQYSAPKASYESRLRMKKVLEENETTGENLKVPAEVEPWNAWWIRRLIVNFPEPKTKPPPQSSELLPFHLIDILYSYCYTMRLYNGDVTFDFEGACDVMITISSILATTEHLPSIKFALNQCINNSKRPDLFVEFQWQIEVVHDVELCLQSNAHVYRALSEAHSIAKEAKEKLVYKKLEFFFAWSQILTQKDLNKLQEVVHEYYTSLQSLLFDINCK